MAKVDLNQLRNELLKLQKNHSVVGLKTGTEVEDMQFDEIAMMRDISKGIVPIIVKIGGPEARNDMRACLDLGVDGVLAPMVETVYALSNFVKSIQTVATEKDTPLPYLAMNLESHTAAANLDDMIESRAFFSLNQITIGRGDLSSSMHLSVDDEAVIDTTCTAVRKIKGQGKVTSVGGGLTLANIELLAKEVPADRFNTRHVVFQNKSRFKKNAATSLLAALSFEQKLYSALANEFSHKKAAYEERIEILARRMGSFKLRKTI